jgi:3-hydroxy-9,10-secoandrosta-1,3,5(10)-triene-9,17-dione monooxygenase
VADSGSYRVKGAWDYCSGCDIATHLLAAILLRDPATQAPAGLAVALFDREHYEIVDNWNMIGMQGTGSRRVVVGERTLPAHRVLPLTGDLWEAGERPGHALFTNPLYLGTPLSAGGFGACAVAVGAARGALDIYEGILRNKKAIVPPFPFRFEMPEMQQSFGSAQALVDTAEAALLALTDQHSELCRTSLEKSVATRAEDVRRIHRAGLQCTELAWQAVELMFRTGGTSSASREAPLGRYFRGLAVMRTHVGRQHDHVSINVARLHFGLPALSPL